ncbi:hypothetical protein [Paraburkholderia bannensis]|uniref:hypothetical protein n=1 Tax=Paraburkholderia bannensis TaxID=765414 RepID=UPI002ABE0EAF|nr:hypothetical protein [Paraburkholderia bannensis]
MKQTSPAATGTAGAVISCLVALLSVANARLGLNLNAQDQVSIATGLVVGAHWLVEQYGARQLAKQSNAS